MKKSIVLGGTSGIGLEVAQSLKSNGKVVTVIGRSASHIENAKQLLGSVRWTPSFGQKIGSP